MMMMMMMMMMNQRKEDILDQDDGAKDCRVEVMTSLAMAPSFFDVFAAMQSVFAVHTFRIPILDPLGSHGCHGRYVTNMYTEFQSHPCPIQTAGAVVNRSGLLVSYFFASW